MIQKLLAVGLGISLSLHTWQAYADTQPTIYLYAIYRSPLGTSNGYVTWFENDTVECYIFEGFNRGGISCLRKP